MSIQSIVAIMDKLCSLHESLYTLSKEKTDMLKEGDTQSLQTLLIKERKHIQAISQLDREREKQVTNWFQSKGIPANEPTITTMLENIQSQEEKQQLEDVFERLLDVLAGLKQQEQLNQELTQQSLQFVELSLDMLQPSMKNMNYGKPNTNQADQGQKRSVFDSKA
ncbi:flagellar protein FlgN [Pontibacillus yanchengensis]|uniref:Flagellar protein FlgN n=1 Tax=Pontibacillus yanchengensis TaxID=462910 RepID=A0A6I5A3U9_9BACI|nr:flagellar protein FlgN [Pontibacillus yanchengensis]MYL33969.1 flagellar protein FlgN [Pontibacillus yanchengensis]